MQCLTRAHYDEDGGRAALLLEQAAYAQLRIAPPRRRKAGFQLVLAGLRYQAAGQRRLAAHCYRLAAGAYPRQHPSPPPQQQQQQQQQHDGTGHIQQQQQQHGGVGGIGGGPAAAPGAAAWRYIQEHLADARARHALEAGDAAGAARHARALLEGAAHRAPAAQEHYLKQFLEAVARLKQQQVGAGGWVGPRTALLRRA